MHSTSERSRRQDIGRRRNGKSQPTLERTTFKTSRLLEFCSEKELTAQIGHEKDDWPLVVVKELLDNALDACEEASVAPEITIRVDADGIAVEDNGPGIPAETINGVLDYAVRVSNREAYVAPDRGAQGNALKTIVAMPFVLDGSQGRVDITANGQRHEITFAVDPIRQEPVIESKVLPAENVKNGTHTKLFWPDSALLNTDRHRVAILTICRRLHLPKPPCHSDR
ncbi:MAG: ATP-binding protein [Candidatus Nealsonbacteria bacterium]|nr:ATP-binding protein [Candidatus Nealsonbacteria bacterium]